MFNAVELRCFCWLVVRMILLHFLEAHPESFLWDLETFLRGTWFFWIYRVQILYRNTWYAIRVCEWYPDSRKVWPGAKSQAWIDENFCPSPSEVYPPKSISDLYLTRYWSRVPPYILPTRSITYSLGHEKGTFRFSGKRKLDCEYRK